MKRIGMLTSGGDCQALNAAMRGVVKALTCSKEEVEIYAKSKGVDFMEVSALKTINVKETFVKLAHNLLEKKVTQKTEAGGDKCCIIF